MSQVDPDIEEGQHYSIMFYGGRLLSHLSAQDRETDQFIDLLRINRNVAVVIDSDRREKGKRINETKRRIREEIDKIGGFCWITEGKEIENYFSPEEIAQAISRIASYEVHSMDEPGQFGRPLRHYKKIGTRRGKLVETVDKVKLSKVLAANALDGSVFGLGKRLKEIVSFINACN